MVQQPSSVDEKRRQATIRRGQNYWHRSPICATHRKKAKWRQSLLSSQIEQGSVQDQVQAMENHQLQGGAPD